MGEKQATIAVGFVKTQSQGNGLFLYRRRTYKSRYLSELQLYILLGKILSENHIKILDVIESKNETYIRSSSSLVASQLY